MGGGGGNRRVIASWPLFPQELVECGFSWQNSDAELKKMGEYRGMKVYTNPNSGEHRLVDNIRDLLGSLSIFNH